MPMSTVRDMIRKKGSEVFSISSDATVYEALTIMATYNAGALMTRRISSSMRGMQAEK